MPPSCVMSFQYSGLLTAFKLHEQFVTQATSHTRFGGHVLLSILSWITLGSRLLVSCSCFVFLSFFFKYKNDYQLSSIVSSTRSFLGVDKKMINHFWSFPLYFFVRVNPMNEKTRTSCID